ncbi:MAG: hypothetical protein BJ554DRAFT_1646, partial [Olpidium bornovanus]
MPRVKKHTAARHLNDAMARQSRADQHPEANEQTQEYNHAEETGIGDSYGEDSVVDQELLNQWLQGVTEPQLSTKLKAGKAGSHLRTVYTGTSRTSDWRKRKAEGEMVQHAKSYQRIDQRFQRATAAGGTVQEAGEDAVAQDEMEKFAAAEQKLRDGLAWIKNQKSELACVSGYQLRRLMVLQLYMTLILEGAKKSEASKRAAEARWVSSTDHACRCIRAWAKAYVKLGYLPEHAQGKHAKRESILDDEDIKGRCLQWLRTTKPQDRSAANLQRELQTNIFPDKLGLEATVSLATVAKFMNFWGFKKRTAGQQIYFDGHERLDVIGYRKEWAKKMLDDFLCECHGPLCLFEDEAKNLKLPQAARVIIQPGKNKDGWWKSADMVKQLEDKALPIFKAL